MLEDAGAGKLSEPRENAVIVSVPEIESVLMFAEEGQRSATEAAWHEIQRGFGAPGDEYLHAVGVLQVASLLRLHHPETEFQVSSTHREPDIILVVKDQLPLAVEVKAKAALWQPAKAIDLSTARRLVRDALADADTVQGQLRADRPGVLALVGLYMSADTYRTVVNAFEGHLSVDGKQIPHVLGFAVANLRSRVEGLPGTVSPLLEQESVLRRNPSYRGALHIDDDWAGPWRLVSR